MRKASLLIGTVTVLLAGSASAQKSKPAPSPAKAQEIFWRAVSGKTTQLLASARDGSNVSVLYTDTGGSFFRFDVGAADSGLISIGSVAGELKLLRYVKNSAGQFVQQSIETRVSGLPRSPETDISPDGSRIAYRGANGSVIVYDINAQTSETWLSDFYAWDFAWARGGSSIVVAQSSPERPRLFEVVGPGQKTELLSLRNIDAIDVSRTDPNLLLVSYNSDDGQSAFAGSWRLPTTAADGSTVPGGWVVPNLAGRNSTFKASWSCDDRFLIFGGTGSGGQQVWYTRDLPSGAEQPIAKAGNATAQSWSKCATPPSTSSDAFNFRTVGN
jgi:hypothetical protein